MTISHKAYPFDWMAFVRELSPILHEALATESVEPLTEFVDAHASDCKDLAFGEPLTPEWRDLLEPDDHLQQIADLALTKYYEPNDDCGLAETWLDLQDKLTQAERAALLGEPFGPTGRVFDPGYQGAFFQDPASVRRSASILRRCSIPREFLEMLQRAVEQEQGLYVTF